MKTDYISRILTPGRRFFAGMVLMLIFFLFESLIIRSSLTAFFLVLVILSGKKILWKNYFLLILFITFFNLLTPWGEVLFTFGPLNITRGALNSGLLKGITFTGLILISLTSIKKGLKIPGKLGGLIGKVFYYFERIFEQKHRLKRHDLIGTLDEILMETYYSADLNPLKLASGIFMNQNKISSKPEILYEDEFFIIVHKEPEELTVPGRGPGKEDCLMSRTGLFYNSVFNVHRLDQPTSGLVLIALTKEMQRLLSILFLNREIEKEYVAVVEGTMAEPSGIIDLPIRADIQNRPIQIIDRDLGKKAITRWDVLDNYRNSTRLLLKPETGRTHQLRVHLNAIGHPILGDRLYNDNVRENLMGELKLHAMSLNFKHPVTGKNIYIVKEPWF